MMRHRTENIVSEVIELMATTRYSVVTGCEPFRLTLDEIALSSDRWQDLVLTDLPELRKPAMKTVD